MRAYLVMMILTGVELIAGYPVMVGCPNCLQYQKKNVFMSRGWGAGGMPIKFVPKEHQLQHELHKPWSKQEDQPEYEEGPTTSFLTSRLKEERQSPHSSHRRQTSIPQLFVSYGWGPLGK